MADILLTHSNHLYSDRKQVRKMQPCPPLQTLMAAARLREVGFAVALVDVTLAESPLDAFREALEEHLGASLPEIVGRRGRAAGSLGELARRARRDGSAEGQDVSLGICVVVGGDRLGRAVPAASALAHAPQSTSEGIAASAFSALIRPL